MVKGSEASILAQRKQGLTIRSLDGEELVFDPQANRATCLNGFAAAVLARCDGKTSPGEIARALPYDNVDEGVVLLALADLRKAGLLEADPAGEAAAPAGPNRRELIRRLGVGGAVAVPVVTAILLPTPADALSAGDPCVINGGDPCPGILQCMPRSNNEDPGNKCTNSGNDCVCQ